MYIIHTTYLNGTGCTPSLDEHLINSYYIDFKKAKKNLIDQFMEYHSFSEKQKKFISINKSKYYNAWFLNYKPTNNNDINSTDDYYNKNDNEHIYWWIEKLKNNDNETINNSDMSDNETSNSDTDNSDMNNSTTNNSDIDN